MSRRRSRSSDGAGGAGFLLLIAIAVVIKFIWWILGAVALVAAIMLVAAVVREFRRHREQHDAQCRALSARADEQHSLVMQGDDRGIYGAEAAEMMRLIRADGLPAMPARGSPLWH